VIARMNVGGPALQVVGLTEGLDPARFEQRLFVGDVEPDEADYLQLRAPHIRPVRVEGLGRSPRLTGDPRALATLVRELRRFRPDIVHTHTAKAGVLGRVAARTVGVRGVVHTYHGHLLHGYFSPMVTRGVVAVERVLARGTTRLLAVGSLVRDDLLAARIGSPQQYRVVPPGVRLPAPPSRADARRELGLPADAPIVCFVARLTEIKRPDRFVDVARRVRAARPDAVFVVAGEGALLDATRDAAADLGDAVRFLGWRSDVEVIYAASDAVVLTSDNEGMPVSLIEAASVGCPAVTTDVGSAREVVLDGVSGFVAAPTADAIADSVVALLADDGRRGAMSAAARAHAGEHFGRDRLVRDTADIYDEVAAIHHLPR
jgi:glycosyltransferase involved in cell wall biosynthesis